jgi:hypothetical protein
MLRLTRWLTALLGLALLAANSASAVAAVSGHNLASGSLGSLEHRLGGNALASSDRFSEKLASPYDFVSDFPVAARGTTAAANEAFHYTFSRAVASIEREGLRAGSYATPTGALSPLQAQIDLALSPTGLRGALMRVDLAGLRQAGYEIPEITQVGRSYGMPGGGFEMQFPYRIPPEFITVVRP